MVPRVFCEDVEVISEVSVLGGDGGILLTVKEVVKIGFYFYQR